MPRRRCSCQQSRWHVRKILLCPFSLSLCAITVAPLDYFPIRGWAGMNRRLSGQQLRASLLITSPLPKTPLYISLSLFLFLSFFLPFCSTTHVTACVRHSRYLLRPPPQSHCETFPTRSMPALTSFQVLLTILLNVTSRKEYVVKKWQTI